MPILALPMPFVVIWRVGSIDLVSGSGLGLALVLTGAAGNGIATGVGTG